MAKVIVFGSLNMDISVECDDFPKRGETITGGGLLMTPGGKGTCQAVACARMGADTFMVGKVGDDQYGRQIVAALTKHGVSPMNVSITRRAATGVALITRAKGDKTIVTDPGANYKMTYAEVRAAIHGLGQRGNIFLTQLGCDPDATYESIKCAKRNGLYTVLNASPVQSLPLDLYPSLDLLCVNATECRAICGIAPMDDASTKEAIDWFAERGVASTVITLGSQGSATVIDSKLVKVPAYHVSVVDTTAAGDAYVGELVAHLAFDGTLEEAMKYGSAAAAICITRVGAQETMPRWDEVEEFVKMREQA